MTAQKKAKKPNPRELFSLPGDADTFDFTGGQYDPDFGFFIIVRCKNLKDQAKVLKALKARNYDVEALIQDLASSTSIL